MLKISDFSKLSNISIRMLRHYDELELLIPDVVDEDTKYRYYSANQLDRSNKIQKLKSIGFSLAVIKEMLKDTEDVPTIEQFFTIRKREIQEELMEITNQSTLLERASSFIKEDVNRMNYNVNMKELPKRKVISLQGIVSDYYEEHKLWDKLYKEVERQHVKIEKVPFCMTIYKDREHKESDIELEVQIAIKGDYTDHGDVKFKEAEEVLVASVIFSGDYEQMPQVSQSIAQWMEDQDYEMAGPMFNIFHISPAQDINPTNWITEACYAIKKR